MAGTSCIIYELDRFLSCWLIALLVVYKNQRFPKHGTAFFNPQFLKFTTTKREQNMHTGKRYGNLEVFLWTRRNVYHLFIIGLIPVLAYEVVGLTFIALPWTVVALLGTATAFIVGFRNSQTYSRTWEARQIWGSIVNSSRTWTIQCRDFIEDASMVKLLVYRHFAWLTALRYAMREPRGWETMTQINNREFQQKTFHVPEQNTPLADEIKKYLHEPELSKILATKNKAAQLLAVQGQTLKTLHTQGQLDVMKFIELERTLKDLTDAQGRSERIKNFPYPRQFATVNKILVKLFVVLLPFCMLNEFDELNKDLAGCMNGYMVWCVVPFSMLISWVFTSLDQIGESTENPFEGNANDVPISQISRNIEIDLREMLGETDLPPALQPENNIIL